MAQDTRRVQTAVLGRPDSDLPLSLPTDRKAAVRYLSPYKGKRFFCGVHIGGCGWRLMDKLYGDRVCHFAHYPDPKGLAPKCERRYFGADSADHLYIHRGLTSDLGRRGGKQRFQGRLVKGRCTDLLVNPSISRSAIKVQFVHLPPNVWTREDEELRARLGRVDWMFGPEALGTTKYLLDRDGYALRVRCEQQGSARVVKIGTQTHDGDLEWSDLKDCDISERGIVTPLLRKLGRVAPRRAAPATRLPGFPLDVEDIVVYPQEKRTRPIEGRGIPEGSHVATTDVQIGDDERIHARLIVPDRIDLLVHEPHVLLKPASVNVMKGGTHVVPIWTIFSAGVHPVRPAEQPSASPAQTTPKAASTAPAQAPEPPQKRTIDAPGQAKGLTRHKLTSLIQDMRQARKEWDQRRLLQLLEANTELLKALTQPSHLRERQVVEELRRWATTKEKTYGRIEQEVRERSAALTRHIDQALANDDLERAQREIDALRKTLVRVSLSNPKFAAEVRSLYERETWLRRAQAERNRIARVRTQETRAESIRKKQHSQLGDLLDRLMKAETAGEADAVRRLYGEGRSLLKKLGVHATSDEKRQLSLTAQWLAALPVKSTSGDEKSPGTSGVTTSPASDEMTDRTTAVPKKTARGQTSLQDLAQGVGDRVAAVLKKAAREQTTVSLQDLAREVDADSWLCTIALVEVDEAAESAGPLLSALVTSPDGNVSPEFRVILAGLNYEVPQTDQALHLIWQREVERTHAFYAEPPRAMPASLVPRKPEAAP